MRKVKGFMLFSTENIENTIFSFLQENTLYCAIVLSALIGKIKESAKSNLYFLWLA